MATLLHDDVLVTDRDNLFNFGLLMTRQKQELPRIGSDTFVDFHGHRELLDACIVCTLADELDDTAVRTEPLVKMTDVLVDLPEQRFVSAARSCSTDTVRRG